MVSRNHIIKNIKKYFAPFKKPEFGNNEHIEILKKLNKIKVIGLSFFKSYRHSDNHMLINFICPSCFRKHDNFDIKGFDEYESQGFEFEFECTGCKALLYIDEDKIKIN